jgi:DNA-binding SARP family transcriptional activator
MRVRLLGPLAVIHDSAEVRLSGRQQRTVLAVLAYEPGKLVSTERLISLIWAEQPPTAARTKLQGQVSAVRRALISTWPGLARMDWPIVTREPGYVLSDDGVTVDLAEYRNLLASASADLASGHLEAASSRLGTALRLWRGTPFADTGSDALARIASGLEIGRLLAVERKASCDLQLGRNYTVAEELTVFLAEHPVEESLRGLLMLALYRLGCRAESLDLYRVGHRLLRDELGIELGPLLRRLHERILADDPELLRPALPPGRSPGRPALD